VQEGKTPIFIPAKLISYMAGIEYRKQARRGRVRAWQPQEEVPREYGPLKAELDGKPEEQQEMFWKKWALWVPDLHRSLTALRSSGSRPIARSLDSTAESRTPFRGCYELKIASC
jgi:hypothetical protein